MGQNSKIDWTDASHNFWYGCDKVSSGCKFCYAERDMDHYGKNFNTVTRAKGFNKPLSWKGPMLVFVNPWSDFFHVDADAWRGRAWDIIRRTPHLTYQILTKRPENIINRLPNDWDDGWPNVWLGVSVENQEWANKRIPELLQIPAKVRFLSLEPLLGPVELWRWLPINCGYEPSNDPPPPNWTYEYNCPELEGLFHWVIVGGESGSGARPMQSDWAQTIRDQCLAAKVPFFFKQWGGNHRIDGIWGGNKLDGKIYHEFPPMSGG